MTKIEAGDQVRIKQDDGSLSKILYEVCHILPKSNRTAIRRADKPGEGQSDEYYEAFFEEFDIDLDQLQLITKWQEEEEAP